MIYDKKILAVITARANSSGLQGKNYRPILEKPLVLWSVLATARSNYIDTTFISTNCPFVKQICQEWIDAQTHHNGGLHPRVHVIDRPDELATPDSKNESALIHAVQVYESRHNGITPDLVINLQPTSPLRRKHLIDICIEKMCDHGDRTLMTVSKHTPFFVQLIKDDGIIWYFDPKNRKMRQEFDDDELFFHDDGCLYITDTSYLFNEMSRLDENPHIYVNDKYSSFQIDDEEDFIILENIMKELIPKGDYVA